MRLWAKAHVGLITLTSGLALAALTSGVASAANNAPGDATLANSADASTDADAVAVAAPGAVPSVAVSGGLQEVVVTATRREEAISNIPVSVTAITAANIDALGIRDFNDVARFTPGVAIDTSGTNAIAIRGISASAGAATTGVYINDTPIQMRALGFSPDQTLPKTFDLERVEVLRGPQGTLFGAGSEGGTVRYILTPPSDTVESTYGRAEFSHTLNGGQNYEAGVAHGGPIIDSELGFRVSAWYRHDGGWIDRYDPYTGTVVDPNTNRQGTLVLRGAMIWQPMQNLTITPEILYQDRKRHDVESYWAPPAGAAGVIFSNPAESQYGSGRTSPTIEPDRYYMPTLKIVYDIGKMQLISNSSYYNRRDLSGYDGTAYILSYFQTVLPGPVPDVPDGYVYGYPPSSPYYPLEDKYGIHLPPNLQGYTQPAYITNWQQNFVQEVRLQSNDPTSPFTWTAGIYWETNRNYSSEELRIQSYAEENLLTQTLFGGPPLTALTTFGYPVYGAPFLPNGDTYFLQNWGHDEQVAVYGELNYNLGPFTFIAGARYAHTWFDFDTFTQEAFLPADFGNTGSAKSNPFTPRLGIQYHINHNNQIYATYSEGFRVGGANAPIPPNYGCGPSEALIGKTPPLSYGPDKVQSYELGAKNSLFNNRVQLANSLYYIKWNSIQQSIYLVSCGLQYTDNVGYAVSKGADIQADFLLTSHLTLNTTAGYNSAYFTQNAPGATPVVVKGNAVAGFANALPRWSTSLGLQYTTRLMDHASFVRFDYEFQGVNDRLTPSQDPRSSQYDPYAFTLPATHFASLRAGTHIGDWEIDLFCDNVFNNNAIINWGSEGLDQTNFALVGANHQPLPPADLPPQPLTYWYSFQPRTTGITVIYSR
jgi:outer membrane receptor protein involved in Fe transport